MIDRAEMIREKGTNRSKFFRGQVDKYTWVDVGSSYLPGEIIAAFLWAQLEEAETVTAKRLAIWQQYHDAFAPLDALVRLRRPIIPEGCGYNAHMYYLLLRDLADRTEFIATMKEHQMNCVFHYVPLHSAPYGLSAARANGELSVTNQMANKLVRIPMWLGIEKNQKYIIKLISKYFNS